MSEPLSARMSPPVSARGRKIGADAAPAPGGLRWPRRNVPRAAGSTWS